MVLYIVDMACGMLNKYLIATGVCYALSTPIGVHIGYLMGLERWPQVIAELIILVIIHMTAPVMWVKAQTLDLKSMPEKKVTRR
jgi:hypothetical protein